MPSAYRLEEARLRGPRPGICCVGVTLANTIGEIGCAVCHEMLPQTPNTYCGWCAECKTRVCCRNACQAFDFKTFHGYRCGSKHGAVALRKAASGGAHGLAHATVLVAGIAVAGLPQAFSDTPPLFAGQSVFSSLMSREQAKALIKCSLVAELVVQPRRGIDSDVEPQLKALRNFMDTRSRILFEGLGSVLPRVRLAGVDQSRVDPPNVVSARCLSCHIHLPVAGTEEGVLARITRDVRRSRDVSLHIRVVRAAPDVACRVCAFARFCQKCSETDERVWVAIHSTGAGVRLILLVRPVHDPLACQLYSVCHKASVRNLGAGMRDTPSPVITSIAFG